jgi:ATP-dependent DNA helicase
MKLQNVVMQLRKVCSHPYLFDWPIDPITQQPTLDDNLVDASGKMMVLDRLLRELFKRGHKVLLFSQFTTMLDLIEVDDSSTLVTQVTDRYSTGLGNGTDGLEDLPY